MNEMDESLLEMQYQGMLRRLELLHDKKLKGYCLLVTFDPSGLPQGKISLNPSAFSRLGSKDSLLPVPALWAAISSGNLLLAHLLQKHDPTLRTAPTMETTT